MSARVGADALARKGVWRSHRWLILRRLSQLAVLVLFLLGPVAGVWVLKGNLSSSLLLEKIPLSDPFVALQVLAAGHMPELAMVAGVLIVTLFYGLLGGRTFCSWVCPINPVTDLAGWAARRLGVRRRIVLSRSLRLWMLGLVVLLPLLLGRVVWEQLNPVSIFHRELIFGVGSGLWIILALFLFDLFVLPGGWCGHLCPQGALYSLLGRVTPLHVDARNRAECYDCHDCFRVCPEPHVIQPALKGSGSPVISSGDCTRCGRCVDICSVNVFAYGMGNANRMEKQS